MNIKITEDCRRILGDYVLQSIDSINNADCKNNVDINKIRIPGIGASANQTNLLRIPKISDGDYDSIKYIMESTGCHWRERYGGFVTYDTRDEFIHKVNNVLRSNLVTISDDKVFQIKNQFYPTPRELAKYMVELADISRTDYVLEPSAGRGAILEFINKKTNHYSAVESNSSNVRILRQNRFRVNRATFESYHSQCLKSGRQFDKIVMNPPFIKGIDCRHIKLAYDLLKPGGKIVGLMAENNLFYDTDYTKDFHAFMEDKIHSYSMIPSGSFIQSGTTVDVVLVLLTKN